MKGYLVSVAVFLCPVTDISATVAPIGVKFYMVVHIQDRSSPVFVMVLPGSPNPKFWA